jgi:hypothetical protein
VPGPREWVFLAGSLAALLWALPPYSWPLYALTLAAVYATGVSGLRRRFRVLVVLALVAGFLALERLLPRPDVPFVLFFGRAIRAFFVLRAIDFVLSRPRRELSARPAHRMFQFLLFVSFLPCLFAGPVVLFNDFYGTYLPGSFAARSALVRNGLKILWGALKFYALGPVVQRAVEDLHSWAYEGGGPPGFSPRSLMWGFLFLQLVDTYIRFSGFTDMAIGASRLLGFQLYENFQYPLLATNPLQFWKSWHISAYRWLTPTFYPSGTTLIRSIQTISSWRAPVAPRHRAEADVALLCSCSAGPWTRSAVAALRAAREGTWRPLARVPHRARS